MAKPECDCAIRWDGPKKDGNVWIHYCPLHATASELLEAITWLGNLMFNASDGGQAWIAVRDQPGAKEWITNMQAAHAKATEE